MADKNLTLRYRIDSHFKKQNEKNFEEMKKALDAFGVIITETASDTVTISLLKESYNAAVKRRAGRKRSLVANPSGGYYHYSDIVFMMQTMTDDEIYTRINLTRATYYRKKRAMKDSTYYKSLDVSRVSDKAYLKSQEFDFYF